MSHMTQDVGHSVESEDLNEIFGTYQNDGSEFSELWYFRNYN